MDTVPVKGLTTSQLDGYIQLLAGLLASILAPLQILPPACGQLISLDCQSDHLTSFLKPLHRFSLRSGENPRLLRWPVMPWLRSSSLPRQPPWAPFPFCSMTVFSLRLQHQTGNILLRDVCLLLAWNLLRAGAPYLLSGQMNEWKWLQGRWPGITEWLNQLQAWIYPLDYLSVKR